MLVQMVAVQCFRLENNTNLLLRRLIRFLKRPIADSSKETDGDGDLMMDSAIEISSGSDSDDEVPIRPQIRTRTDPIWLGIVFDISLSISVFLVRLILVALWSDRL